MSYSNISQLVAAINSEITTNGNEEITGEILNDILLGLTQFIEQSPLNWDKATIYSSGGDIVITNDYVAVVVFMSTTPDSLSFGDNIYFEYVFINMTAGAIELETPSFYYNAAGTAVSTIAANSSLNIVKASNDLWIQVGGSGGGGGSTQKEPLSFKVGTTTNAPTAGQNSWTLPAFGNSYVVLFINGQKVNQSDMGNGSPYSGKGSLASSTVTVGNYSGGFVEGDIVEYILITP